MAETLDTMPSLVDAFMLHNEQEEAIPRVVQHLTGRGISTYFWRRDIAVGEEWLATELRHIRTSRTVVVFLGAQGWGPNHLKLTETAQRANRKVIPVLIGDPPQAAYDAAGGLFNRQRYIDLRLMDAASLDGLVQTILAQSGASAALDKIVKTLVDGNEEQRSDLLHQIVHSGSLERDALARRLCYEIQERFAPSGQQNLVDAYRDPSKISSIRSWMLSTLIWTGIDDEESRTLLLRHLQPTTEPDRTVRYWVLAGLQQRKAPYLREALDIARNDPAGEVHVLVGAIAEPDNEQQIATYRSMLQDSKFEVVWSVLRALRRVAIPALVLDICQQLERIVEDRSLTYDTLYALSHPDAAATAASQLAKSPGVERVIDLVIRETGASDSNAARNFAPLLGAFDPTSVERLLNEKTNQSSHATVGLLKVALAEWSRDGDTRLLVAGYASDIVDTGKDQLDIREDVEVLSAVILSKDATPPLAIGLFGDWGTGKSFFMQAIRQTTATLAARAKTARDPRFCWNIAPIEFNAWHYADTNLWASLVNHILEKLAAHIAPQKTPEQQRALLLSQLESARRALEEATADRKKATSTIAERQTELENARQARLQKEIEIRDLRLNDLRKLLEQDEELSAKLAEASKDLGFPALLSSARDLSRALSMLQSAGGRATALLTAMTDRKQRTLRWGLLAVLLLAPFVLPPLLRMVVSEVSALLTTATLEVVGVLGGITALLQRAGRAVSTHLDAIEIAKKKADEFLAQRRREPTEKEKELDREIINLKAEEQAVSARLDAAAARVLELEQRIGAINDERNLMRFLEARMESEDYRRHLGLISVIRRDFEDLVTRMMPSAQGEEAGDTASHVERIVLYIDDLDRCPPDKVVDVLQAVHLLLAFPLFVVVVGVDPRWLLNSLAVQFSPFGGNDAPAAAPDLWRATPQSYLEKIFQIPVNLRPMSEEGYARLVGHLFEPASLAAKDKAVTPSTPRAIDPPRIGRGGEATTVASDLPPPTGFQLQDAEAAQGVTADGPTKTDARTAETAEPAITLDAEALIIKPVEIAFAKRLFSFIPTPRSAKRFSNTYRLLKAPVRRERLLRYEGTPEMPGEFQVPMLLLAILIAAPAEASVLFPLLLSRAAARQDMGAALRQPASIGLGGQAFEALARKLATIIDDPSFPEAPELFHHWIPRVSRFSFEAGRTVGMTTAKSTT